MYDDYISDNIDNNISLSEINNTLKIEKKKNNNQ